MKLIEEECSWNFRLGLFYLFILFIYLVTHKTLDNMYKGC